MQDRPAMRRKRGFGLTTGAGIIVDRIAGHPGVPTYLVPIGKGNRRK